MRIVDFGLSISLADLQNPQVQKTKAGTAQYMAPENDQILPVQDGTKIDIFSLGVILFVMYF